MAFRTRSRCNSPSRREAASLSRGEDRRGMSSAPALPAVLGTVGLLVVLSLLRPVDAYRASNGAAITPTCFVYLPQVAKEPTATPTPTSTPTPSPTPTPSVDLIVWDIIIDPAVPQVGRTFAITVKVINLGPDDTTVDTYIRLEVAGLQLQTSRPPLPAYTTCSADWALSLGGGTYTARGIVDYVDIIAETNEGNNYLEQGFSVE